MMAQILQHLLKNITTIAECEKGIALLEIRDSEGKTAIQCANEYVYPLFKTTNLI